MSATAIEEPEEGDIKGCEICGDGPCWILGAILKAIEEEERLPAQVISLEGIASQEAVHTGDQ